MLQFTFAQITYNFGPELGIAVSRFPTSSSSTIGNDKITEKYTPLLGPLAGIHAQMVVKKLFLFTTGLEYNMCGQKYTYHEDGIDASHSNTPFTTDIVEKQSFQKICFLLSVGCTFRLFKLHFSLYGGWRPNYFITGKYDNTTTTKSSLSTLNTSSETTYNPLDKNVCYSPVNHFNQQYYCGISISKRRFELAFNYCMGFKILYYQDPLAYNNIEYKNNDFTAALRYRFFAFKRVKVKCNVFD